jgi:hypothetical protein
MMEKSEKEETIKRKSNRQAASNKKYNNSESDSSDEREKNYRKFVGESSDLDEDYEKSLKRGTISDSSESESENVQVRKKFKSKATGASKSVESSTKVVSSLAVVQNPFRNQESLKKIDNSVLGYDESE